MIVYIENSIGWWFSVSYTLTQSYISCKKVICFGFIYKFSLCLERQLLSVTNF